MEQSIEKKIYYVYKSTEGSSDKELYDVLNKVIRVKMMNVFKDFQELSPLFLEVMMGNQYVALEMI